MQPGAGFDYLLHVAKIFPGATNTIYEFEGEDAEEAERVLGAYQADPNGWSKRLPNNDSMGVVGAGWYLEEVSFGTED